MTGAIRAKQGGTNHASLLHRSWRVLMASMRRWFQFSVTTLLWLTAIVAAFLAGAPLDRYLAERHADPSESKIWAALNEKTEIDFFEKPLTDVFDYLKQRHEIEIQLDMRALTDAGVGSDTPITRSIKGVTLRSALNLLLNELDLTYLVRNGVLVITSNIEAENMPDTTHPLFNLKTIPWLAVVVAAFLGGFLVGRKSRQRVAAAPLP